MLRKVGLDMQDSEATSGPLSSNVKSMQPGVSRISITPFWDVSELESQYQHTGMANCASDIARR